MKHLILIENEIIEDLRSSLIQIKNLLEKKKDGPNINLLRTSEVKEILKIKDSTLAALRSNGTLPFAKIAGTIYYKLEDIKFLIDQNYSGTNGN